MAVEQLEKRFGTIAVEKGFITKDQLIEVINTQVMEDIEGKKHRLIGTIMFEQGVINIQKIDEVLKSMGIPVETFNQ